MKDLINDISTAIGVVGYMRRARAEGKDVVPQMVRRYPRVARDPSFFETIEGCMFASKDRLMRNTVWRVFEILPHEDRKALCSSPENGRFLARTQLWRAELEAVLPPKQYHEAMGAILHLYAKIKRDCTRRMSMECGREGGAA